MNDRPPSTVSAIRRRRTRRYPDGGHGPRHRPDRWQLGFQRCGLICGLWTVVCGLLSTGCVRRTLTIKTEPPGALIYMNDAPQGTSPVTYDFAWYGWYRVMARKDGFARLDDRRLLRCPVYLWIPLDLFMELLPLPIHDTRVWSYTLTPAASLRNPTPPPATEPSSGVLKGPRLMRPVQHVPDASGKPPASASETGAGGSALTEQALPSQANGHSHDDTTTR